MLELRNQTPFVAALVPGLGKEGAEYLTVVVKGTFTLDGRGGGRVAEEQVPMRHADEAEGDPAASSTRYEADASPLKPGTDVVLVGAAVSTRPVKDLVVGLAVGTTRKAVR